MLDADNGFVRLAAKNSYHQASIPDLGEACAAHTRLGMLRGTLDDLGFYPSSLPSTPVDIRLQMLRGTNLAILRR